MNKINKLLTLIEDAMNGIKQEIEKGDQGIDSSEHLQFIFSVLLEMKSHLSRSSFGTSDFNYNIARFVIDTWPLNHPLGEQICQIQYEYDRMMCKSRKESAN